MIGIILSFIFICSFLFILFTINRIYEKYVEDDPMLIDIKNTLLPVFPDINKVILLKGKKSYTINKKKIHLCLFDENGKYYDKNMLIYVTLHELAHVRCDEVGHTDKFHRIFKEILDEATQKNVYDPKKPIIKNYCNY
jgi:hypothetical protein